MSTITYETIRASWTEGADVLAEVKIQVPDAKAVVLESIDARDVWELRDGTGNVCEYKVTSYEYRVKAVI